MPLAIAAFRVGHSADGSVADTMSALAPLVIAAWRAGICEAGVAAVPLVSVAVSPSVASAAMAPPDFTLSAVVKYGLPRFFGTMKTFSPVFRPPEADAPEPARSTAGAHRTLFVERLILESFQPEMYYWGPCCGGPRY